MINEIRIVNNIGIERARARTMSEGLKCNSTLTELNLRCDEKNDKEEKKQNK